MRIMFTEHFRRSYRSAPPAVQKAFEKQLTFLEKNIHHPSLHAKKYDERHALWQARATKAWRFYFVIGADLITILDLIDHPK